MIPMVSRFTSSIVRYEHISHKMGLTKREDNCLRLQLSDRKGRVLDPARDLTSAF